jgi:hypothetical protein
MCAWSINSYPLIMEECPTLNIYIIIAIAKSILNGLIYVGPDEIKKLA